MAVCTESVTLDDLYSKEDPRRAVRAAALAKAGLPTTGLTPKKLTEALTGGTIKDASLLLELKAILDDVQVAAGFKSAKTTGGGLPRITKSNMGDILSAANPDAFKITHLATGNSLWVPGTCTSFKEKYSPTYTREMVYGRMDPITTYGSTSRNITFNWEVDTEGGSHVYALGAVGDVIKFMYPLYDNTTLKGAPTLRVKFLNLLQNTLQANKGLIVVVDSFDISGVDGTAQGMNAVRRKTANGALLIPQSYDLTFAFTVLHEEKVVGFTSHGKFGQGNQFPYGYPSTISNTPHGPADAATKLNVRKADQPSLMELTSVKKRILT